MFALVQDKEGSLNILQANEKLKLNDESNKVLLQSYNRFYLEQTKEKLLNQVKVTLSVDNKDCHLVAKDTIEKHKGITNNESCNSQETEKEQETEKLLSSSDSCDNGSEISSDEEYSDHDSETNDYDHNSESEFELEQESEIDSNESGGESDDSLIEKIRSDYVSFRLPDISVSSTNLSGKGLIATSLVENSSCFLSDQRSKDPDYVLSATNISAEASQVNTVDTNTNDEFNASYITRTINDNIVKYVDNAEPPDYETVTIQPVTKKGGAESPRKRKLHQCTFCGKDQSHLKRHLLRKHKNEPAVQQLKKSSSTLKGSRKPMKQLLYAGDLKHNSDKEKFTGEFRVARRPKLARKTVTDYTACPTCKAMVLAVEFRKHVTVCAGVSGKGCRNLKYLGNQYMRNCHARASVKMRKQILFRMRNDKVLRAIKYDPLLIEYGNEICEHLRGAQHKTNICTKLRRLGRLKIAMKEKKFEDILISAKSLKVVKTLELMASDPDNRDSDYLKFPTLAENLATLVKQVAKTQSVLCLRNDEHEVRKSTQEFIECFENDYRTRLSRMVSESHGKCRREKVTELPSSEDIKHLYTFLSNIRKTNYNILEKEFCESSYLRLLKSTLTSLQVFNSRRPGDVERIFLNEYVNKQQICKDTKLNYNNLPADMKDLANEFALIHSRGKWGNDIKLLVPPDIQLCINKLIELRPQMNISPKNMYLFALPKTPLAEIRHPSAYILLSRFAEMCGANKPILLRATGIRKNLATKCIELNLNDAELTDLAAYMGHHVDIHKSHYRKNIVTRDIPLFLKFVHKALETKKPDEATDSELDEPENNCNSIGECADNSVTADTIDFTSNQISDSASNSDVPSPNDRVAMSTRSKSINKKKIKNKRLQYSPKEVGVTSRARWSNTEIKIIYKEFDDFLNGKTNEAPAARIRKMMAEHPNHFKGRNEKSIRTWMHIRRKKV